MLQKRCAGGIVFYKDQVLLLHNHKHEWILPKGGIERELKTSEGAVIKVRKYAGLDTQVLEDVCYTEYEGFSVTKKRPVHVRVHWYLLELVDSQNEPRVALASERGYDLGGFFSMEEALEKLTYSQEKVTLLQAYQLHKNQADISGV